MICLLLLFGPLICVRVILNCSYFSQFSQHEAMVRQIFVITMEIPQLLSFVDAVCSADEVNCTPAYVDVFLG